VTPRLWHGGVPDLRPGDLIIPQAADAGRHLVDGCPTCEARRDGRPLSDDDNNPHWVYVTTNREYARLYAHGYPRGALYQVEAIGELHDRTGTHDPHPSWGVEAARVLTVYDPVVIVSPNQQRRWLRMAGLLAPKGLA
jgi:hypothetical protein